MYETLMRVYKEQSIRMEENIKASSNSLLKSTVGSIKTDNVRLISLFSLKNLTGFKLSIE